MKLYIKQILIAIGLLLVITSCQKDSEFGEITALGNVQVTIDVVGKNNSNPDGDGSGKVNLKAVCSGAISYKYIFADGTTQNVPSGIYQKTFTTTGVNTYSVTVIASGKAGISSSKTFNVKVRSDFSDPESIAFLTGGTSKKWYWSASEPGHLGVGQNDGDATKNYFPNYYQAAPFEKSASASSSCLYENELTFSLQNGILKYELNNKGKTFFNVDFQGIVGGNSNSDGCYDYNTAGLKTVLLGPSESLVAKDKSKGTTMTFSDNGFMGYYIGQNKYEILSITENRMVVRAVMGGNSALAWYHTFTTTKPSQNDSNFTNLVWSDEFNTAGAPDPTKWAYDIGKGPNNDGWGNNEAQTYTNNSSNVTITNGKLVITAKKEALNGAQYTSARLITSNLYSFKYGKAVIRAKLPSGAGTWPAIWMLGQNISTVGWPSCGEIDIMEHVGNRQNSIYNTLHFPGNSGGNAIGNGGAYTNATASTAFHDYSIVWTATDIKFYVDDALSYTFTNKSSLPFNANFFLIFNVAMGGTFGGAIDPSFTQASMEIDYVRIYQ